ncbi:MAG: winged helix-turn-helix transcriptional regulator [Candidatus Saccharibacteria bacterium]
MPDMPGQETVNVLDIDHVFSILEYLHINQGKQVLASDLRQVMPNYGRMMVIVKQLEEKGLIEIKVETKPRKRYMLSLTKEGKIVIKKLIELDRMIQKWQPEPD